MREENMRSSDNVEDQRGMGGGGFGGGGGFSGGGGFGGFGGGGGGGRLTLGGGITMLIVVVLYLLLGGNPNNLIQPGPGGGGGGGGPGSSAATTNRPLNDARAKFVAHVLGDTEDVWTDLFHQMGRTYEPPKLVLFDSGVNSGCGFASSATGPFYCPADSKVYIDLTFFDELTQRFGAPGDAAQAYVIAHEVGHHVQHLLGTSGKVEAQMKRVSDKEANHLSVQLELQADFYAGVWAFHAQKARNILEAGDIEEALRCAAAIGDDRLQKQARGSIAPDSFTHGTSAQRAKWLRRGLETGDLKQGDTFKEER